MGESLGLSTPSADRTWGQSATAVPAQVGADTLLGFGLSEAWRAGKQRLGYAVPKSSVGGRLATSAKGGLAANVAFDLATSAPESVGNWANAVRGREFDPTETLGQQMNSLDIQRGNSAEGALQGLQSPVGTMQAGVHGIADTIDAKAQGDQARTQFNRLDAAGVQNMVRTADAHKRYFQALDRGHPFQVPWQDPETGLVHNFDNTAAYRSAISQATQYAGKTEFERQTQGQGLQDRVWHDAASRGMATGWATDVSRAVNPWTTPLVSGTGQRAVVPGTGVAIKSPTEMASLGRLVNPRRWLRGEFSVNPFVARE